MAASENDFNRPNSADDGDLTPKQKKALAALLICQTQREAADKAGIGERTLRTYLTIPAFQKAYTEAFNELVKDATKQAQKALSPAISVLHEIMADKEQSGGVRISAARSILEYGLKFTEFTELTVRIDDLERKYKELEERNGEY